MGACFALSTLAFAGDPDYSADIKPGPRPEKISGLEWITISGIHVDVKTSGKWKQVVFLQAKSSLATRRH